MTHNRHSDEYKRIVEQTARASYPSSPLTSHPPKVTRQRGRNANRASKHINAKRRTSNPQHSKRAKKPNICIWYKLVFSGRVLQTLQHWQIRSGNLICHRILNKRPLRGSKPGNFIGIDRKPAAEKTCFVLGSVFTTEPSLTQQCLCWR